MICSKHSDSTKNLADPKQDEERPRVEGGGPKDNEGLDIYRFWFGTTNVHETSKFLSVYVGHRSSQYFDCVTTMYKVYKDFLIYTCYVLYIFGLKI